MTILQQQRYLCDMQRNLHGRPGGKPEFRMTRSEIQGFQVADTDAEEEEEEEEAEETEEEQEQEEEEEQEEDFEGGLVREYRPRVAENGRGVMVVGSRPLKRGKRVSADIYPFASFGTQAAGAFAGGPFRDNVRNFLTQYAGDPASVREDVRKWRLRLRLDNDDGGLGTFVNFDIYEQNLRRSRHPHCDHCRVVAGWHTNPVCAVRYHFVIPSEVSDPAHGFGKGFDTWAEPCAFCGAFGETSESNRCKACNSKMGKETSGDEDGDSVFEDPKHLLHGIVHSNGFGHLLRVNGREGGSRFLSGCDIMDLWERVCTMLKVRKVSVMDVSKKYGLDYRLLHALLKGHPWYGNWGYEFFMGSFAITKQEYTEALEWLSNLLVSLVLEDIKYDKNLYRTILFYCILSQNTINSLKDLLCFIIELLHACQSTGGGLLLESIKNYVTDSNPGVSNWNEEEINGATKDVVNILKVLKGSWISWNDLKGAACNRRNPKLIDYVLSSLGMKKISDLAVYCRMVPSERTFEFRLINEANLEFSTDAMACSDMLTKNHLLDDLRALFHNLISPYRSDCFDLGKRCAAAAQKILDCKQFIKNYEENQAHNLDDGRIRVLATVHIFNDTVHEEPPPELLVLNHSATVGDVKASVEAAFRDVYRCLKSFKAESIVETGGVKDTMNFMILLGPECNVTVQGTCKGPKGAEWEFRTEKGTQSWIVDCPCGVKEDDGERMVACDVCGVWQHTRCVGIPDVGDVPLKYLCRKCKKLGKSVKAVHDLDDRGSDYSLPYSMLEDSSYSDDW